MKETNKKAKFFKKKLKNGMTVIFEERKNSGVVSVAFGLRCGAVNESKAEKGISHFIEHMLFKGTNKRNSKQISEEIEKQGGMMNGFTEEELTFYTCKMPSHKIHVALEVLSDMIKNPAFDEKELNKERQVIFEELKLYRDNPRLWIHDNLHSCLFSGSAGMNLGGTEETLNSIDRKKMIKKFNQVYTANSLILCVVGDATLKKLCDYCEKNFKKAQGKIPEQRVGQIVKKKIEERKGIDQANLALAFHVPPAFNKDNYASQVLSCIIGGGMSSRLWQEIREKRNLAYSISSNCTSGKRFGYITVLAGTSPQNVEKIKELIILEFGKVARELGEKELNQAKEQLIGNSRISREDSSGQMLDLLCNEIWGDAKKSYEYEKMIKAVKLCDVKRIASKVKEGNYSFLALIPEDGKR